MTITATSRPTVLLFHGCSNLFVFLFFHSIFAMGINLISFNIGRQNRTDLLSTESSLLAFFSAVFFFGFVFVLRKNLKGT